MWVAARNMLSLMMSAQHSDARYTEHACLQPTETPSMYVMSTGFQRHVRDLDTAPKAWEARHASIACAVVIAQVHHCSMYAS